MLYSVALRLESVGPQVVTPPNGYQVYSLLLWIVRSVNPSLAAQLHEGDGPRPFTTSLLPARRWSRRRPDVPAEPTGLWLRFTSLRDETFASLVEAVMRLGPEQSLELGEGRYRCRLLATTPRQSTWARCSSFEDLLANAPDEPTVSLRFLSPTTFRSGGRRSVLFPDASLVFGSLLSKWNAFSAIPMDTSLLRAAFSSLQPVHYRLGTRAAEFGTYEELGFKGTCTYAVHSKESSEVRRSIQALATFSLYSGVGAKTTMGMGQCRKVSNARFVSHGARSHPAEGGGPAPGN